MKVAAVVLLSVSSLLASCASPPPRVVDPLLMHDELFEPTAMTIDPDQALAVSDEMRIYLAARVMHLPKPEDRRQQLMDALYREGDLKLEYDTAVTRTAAQAFHARAGNCLALVMMTGALAKELGVFVRYQRVVGEEAWDRSDEMFISVGHVNLSLTTKPLEIGTGLVWREPLVVDFVPPKDKRKQHVIAIAEKTVVAMYLNNRAVELLVEGRTDDAYWWAREAVMRDDGFMSAYVTLSVLYRNRHRPDLAERALDRVLEREPGNLQAMSNRIVVLRDLGRNVEADQLAAQVRQRDPHPPFSYFDRGMVALRAGQPDIARDLFLKELDRAPYHPEFEYWLAVAYQSLDDPKRAESHLARAIAVSSTRNDRDLYSAKLDRFKAFAVQ